MNSFRVAIKTTRLFREENFGKFILTLHARTPQNGQTHSDNLPTNCLSLFDHFVGLALKELMYNLIVYGILSFYRSTSLI